MTPVPFGDDALLIDFEDSAAHTRTEVESEKTRPLRIVEKIATEVLIMTPDGKMIARNSADDAKNPRRTERYRDYLNRVKEAREGPKKYGSPFDCASAAQTAEVHGHKPVGFSFASYNGQPRGCLARRRAAERSAWDQAVICNV